MATIKDVAKLAGVSISTVSRALSGNIPVSDETRKKVMEAVKELNYQPNVLAKGLKQGKTNTIGLLIPNIRNPIFPAVARGVEDFARKNGYTVILCNTDENIQLEQEYVQTLRKRWVDGLIFATAGMESEHILELKKDGFPVVLAVRDMEDLVDTVKIDNFKAAYEAMNYLIGKGYKRIAIINGKLELSVYNQRFEAYKKALRDANLPIIEDLIVGDTYKGIGDKASENGYAALKKLLKAGNKFDAVFATNDLRAIGAIRAIKDHGLKVPKDIAVMGFDDLEFSSLLDPPLTTVSQPLYQIGIRAVKRLLTVIENKGNHKPHIEILDTHLEIREST